MAGDTQRRLAAIVSADVVGYSRLMGVDEEGTLAALRAHRAELIDARIAEHGGRIVKTMGDGLLLEFPSVVNATQCVIEIQQGMAERNDGIDEDKRIAFRVGVNLGDIIIEGEDIHGDGVNIAARLQEIAEPGGVAISRRVHEDVQDRLDAPFDDAGEQTLKNIARPVHVWRWSPSSGSETLEAAATPTSGCDLLALLDKPAIAVLPFDNMSGDSEQAYFADGITEDIITELSRYRSLMVIARNSSFAYKGRSISISTVGRELDAQYVLEGSVRKAGNRIRVTAQLIDIERGDHLWAERFDRNLENIFAVQDEITQIVVGTIAPKLQTVSAERVMKEDPARLSAYDLVLRALGHWHRFTKKDHVETERLIRAAIEIDPTYSRAYSVLAVNLTQSRNSGYADDPDKTLSNALKTAERQFHLTIISRS